MSDGLAHIIAHQIRAHHDNPIHDDEVIIPVIAENFEFGKELLRDVANRLRNDDMPAWISRTGLEMIYGKLRLYVDNTPISDPICLRRQVALMAVLPPRHTMSAYKHSVLDEVLNEILMPARVMGYQGFVSVVDSNEQYDNGERYL